MKLTYRGHSYDSSQPIQPPYQGSVKMIYRGHTYERTLKLAPAYDHLQGPTVTLIYRGQIVSHVLAPRPRSKPAVINWRFAMAATP